jgi:hypothetical protein
MKSKLTILLIVFVALALAQKTGSPVVDVLYPYDQPTILYDYGGGTDLIYQGYASSKQPSFTWTKAGNTLTQIVVATNVGTVTTATAHGLAINNAVTVSGSTTGALNATYKIATVPSTTTFTIATSGVSDATYNNALMTMTSTAPRNTAAIWSIKCMTYVSAKVTSQQWVNGNAGAMNQIWANRATLACQ